MDAGARPYRFYGAEISYFSAKARPAFRIKRVAMEEILPTPAAYRDVIRPRTGLAMIPTVVTPDDDTWQDSSDILDALDRRFPEPPLHAPTPIHRMIGLLLELYADEFLIVPGLYWRWCFPESVAKALADFASASGDAASAHRFSDGVRGFTGMVGVTAATGPVIEAHTRELLEALEAHFAEHPWLLGGHPSLADCALMGPLYGHLYNDAVPGRLLRKHAPRTCHWIERMNHPDPETFGDLVPDDAVPPTLRQLVILAARDTVPLMLDATRAFASWVDASPMRDGELPRAVGTLATVLGGAGVERLTLPYSQWMVQRVVDRFAALPDRQRGAVEEALAGTGWEPLLAWRPRHRVERRPFKLYLAAAA